MILYQNIEFILKESYLIFGIFFFIFGCLLGSFFNVVILRYPLMMDNENAENVQEWLEDKNIFVSQEIIDLNQKINFSFPASHCFSCKKPLRWYHNIPLVSYIVLKGKCAFCKVRISLQYPFIELLTGSLLLSSYLVFMPQGLTHFLLASFIILTCFVMSAIDIKIFMLPDTLIYILLWVGLFLTTQNISLLNLTSVQAIYGAMIGFLSLYILAAIGKLIKRQEVMGQGDFKLLAALGVYVGIKGVIFTFFFSPFVGILTWILLKFIRKGGNILPYGPALMISSVFYIIYGNDFLKFLGIII